MKKSLLLFVFAAITTVTFASFPVKVERAKTELSKVVAEITENPLSTEYQIEADCTFDSLEEYPAPSRDATWMGVVSISCAFLAWIIFWPFAIPAVIFGAMGLNKRLKGLAIGGMTLGILALLVIAAFL